MASFHLTGEAREERKKREELHPLSKKRSCLSPQSVVVSFKVFDTQALSFFTFFIL